MGRNASPVFRMLRACGIAAALTALTLSPVRAYVYDPPWADGMWAHFPGAGGLDTTGTINYVEDQADAMLYTGFSTNPSSAPAALGTSFAQSDAIWWMAGHGAAGIIQTYNTTAGWGTIFVSSSVPGATCGTPNDCLTDYTSTQMHRIRLMLFMACDTADTIANGDALHKRAYNNLGVDSSLGFTAIISFSASTDKWSQKFGQEAHWWPALSVSGSAAAATAYVFSLTGQYYGFDSYSIYGGTTKISPAAYGS